ncbi:HAD-like protein [Cutaneotrichosporon oleaginosum]|uniref:HAD-like protein n=1 Tax=Cutaneotrichosporon oleaginosum TaxID=879819 RepID=A0A0J0XDA4_9TREE|nr:HAD-like protein [Cutaneotrichosporon oleaginosum]KLT39037.1 HAD-like protein [Cutaneotrichosporon oleaginosum]
MTMSKPPLTLLIDCDNTLVLSEHLAFAGCATLINRLLSQHGISRTYTGAELESRFVGQNFRGILASLSADHGLSLPPTDVDVLATAEVETVLALLRTSLLPAPGAAAALARAQPHATLAVVSSSAARRVHVSLQTAGLAALFGPRVYSAASSLPVPSSKPDPAVYLHAMVKLGVPPAECVAVEDSRSGVVAAVRAGIATLGYVGALQPAEREAAAEKLSEAGAAEIMYEWSEFGACLAKMGHPLASA